MTDSIQGESIPRAGLLGRALRALAGGYQIYFVWLAVRYFADLRLASIEEQPTFWAAAAFGLYLLPWAVNLGFRSVLNIPRSRLFAAIAAGGLFAVTWNYAAYDAFWRPILTTYVIVTAFYAHGHVGLSNLIAAIVGLRGCEMRVIPYLLNRLSGKETELALCPGIWTSIDRWEASLRQR